MKKLYVMFLGLALLGSFGIYHYRPFSTRMGSFVTDVSARSPAQRRNIERVDQRLNEVILQAGEDLSLNELAGPYTVERGYEAERSFVGKGVGQTPGGGVCQVASTLYNAALSAGLKVLERIPHSQEVVSVPRGKDATLAYGVADLKLKNPYPFPVQIRSRIQTDQLLIEIWGKEPPHVFELSRHP